MSIPYAAGTALDEDDNLDAETAPDPDEESADAPDEDVEEDEEEIEDEDEQGSGATAGARGPRRASTPRAERLYIKRIVAKATAIEAADATTRATLATLLDTKDDVSDLTAAVMTARRGSFAVAAEVTDLLTQESADRAIAALTMEPAQFRATWALIASLGGLPEKMPASNAEAARALAKADIDVFTISERLDAAVALGRKA